jgi:hypothetical protein
MNPEKKKVNTANRRRHRSSIGGYSPACAMRTKTTQPIAGLGAFDAYCFGPQVGIAVAQDVYRPTLLWPLCLGLSFRSDKRTPGPG